MEFKTLRNIENSFRQIRLVCHCICCSRISVVGFSRMEIYRFAETNNAKKSMCWTMENR